MRGTECSMWSGQGGYVMCMTVGKYWTKNGHWITIYGYDDNGFMVNDPGSYDRSCQYCPYSVISGDIERIYALGSLGIY